MRMSRRALLRGSLLVAGGALTGVAAGGGRARGRVSRPHAVVQWVRGGGRGLPRPPYGHIGGSTLLAADSLGYDVVLWSHQMHEAAYRSNPEGQVRDIVDHVTPGSIVLAH